MVVYFNIRRCQAVAKVTNNTIFDLQNADDAALPSHTPDGLQQELDAISSAQSFKTGRILARFWLKFIKMYRFRGLHSY